MLRRRERIVLYSKLKSVEPELKKKLTSLLMRECKNIDNISEDSIKAAAWIFAATLSDGKRAISWRLVSKYADVMSWHGHKVAKSHLGRVVSELTQKGLIERIGKTLFLKPLAECVV